MLNENLEQSIAGRRRRWLVTGAAGFIGSHLVEHLLRLEQEVVAIDNFSSGKRANLRGLQEGCHASRLQLIAGDIRDPDICSEVCRDVDYVLHQAALSSVVESFSDPVETYAVNVSGTLNLMWAALRAGVSRFVFASSSAVYGDHPQLPNREDRVGRQQSPYAVSKYAGELYARNFHHSFGLNTVILRYFNIYGPRQDHESGYAAVIPRFSHRMLSSRPVQIFGDGRASRDFCHVDNVVQANLLSAICDRRHARGSTFNVSCGEEVEVLQIYSMAREYFRHHHPELEIAQPEHLDPRPGEVRRSLGDWSRISKTLGYRPVRMIAEGLPLTLQWYRENPNLA